MGGGDFDEGSKIAEFHTEILGFVSGRVGSISTHLDRPRVGVARNYIGGLRVSANCSVGECRLIVGTRTATRGGEHTYIWAI